jgi:ADP-dependent NAD(P)H-hydrate dehydratase / NAD(P)H-hydrate epimerase
VTLPLVLSVAESRAVDQQLVRRSGLPSLLLMENAGRGIAELVLRRLPEGRPDRGRRVAIVCGPGNNGGDGFVVARHLALAGGGGGAGPGPSLPAAGVARPRAPEAPPEARDLVVEVFLAAPASKLSGDAALMFAALTGAIPEVRVHDRSEQLGAEAWKGDLAGADVVVDALFGTGLRSVVVGIPALAIAAINAAHRDGALVVAADVPSGIDADTGHSYGVAVEADVTATVGTYKLGLVLDPSAQVDRHVGEVEVVGLGFAVLDPRVASSPAAAGSGRGGGPAASLCYLLTDAHVRALLPSRAGDAYKGTAGHLAVVAGSAGKTGAAVLVARAAMRSGAGLVTVATTSAGQAALDAKVVEIMTASYASGDDAEDGTRAAIDALLGRPQVRALALGPGIPVGPRMQALVRELARSIAVPTVIDADGLNALGAEGAALLAEAAGPRVITPHLGEMARLAGLRTEAVQSSRLTTARAFAERSGAIVVLKGARTLIAAPDGTVFVSPIVEPALATAGSGDVLTGVIGALLVQGLEPLAAALLGVMLHGRAGGVAARLRGSTGVMAGDLPDAVAEIQRAWRAGAASPPQGASEGPLRDPHRAASPP